MTVVTKYGFPLVGVQFKTVNVACAAQNDDVVFDDAGVQVICARLNTGAAATITRNTLTAGESATIASTVTSIAYTGGVAGARKSTGYYCRWDNEIVFVGADSGSAATTGTLTGIVRGALGTTPTSHASTSTLYIMNSFNLGDNQTSDIEFTWIAMPPDPRGPDFTKAPSTPGSIPSVT